MDIFDINTEQITALKDKLLKGIEKTESGCWLYKKSCSGQYSKIRWNKKWHSGHRASFSVFKGQVPKGKWVCHKCDVPKCVNPDHLYIGSASDNRKDAVAKRRIPLGEKSHFSKFTDIQVSELRLLKKEGFTYERLARIFNCTYAYINYVTKNEIRKAQDVVPT